MTKKEIRKRVKEIKELFVDEQDNELAHIKEDELREIFIKTLSKRQDHLGEKARLVLATNNLNFERWYS